LGGNLFDFGDVVSEERASEGVADGDALLGTRLGEAGERLRSARARTKDVTVTQQQTPQSQKITRTSGLYCNMLPFSLSRFLITGEDDSGSEKSEPSPSAYRDETAMPVEADAIDGVPNGGADEEVRDDDGDSIFD
jgi:hypothetical protein